jgi:DNA-binding beta-propeller fold protein YncE
VVNINSFSETSTITVPQNPLMIEATASGEIYFSTSDLSWFNGNPSNLHLLNPVSKQVTRTFDIRASRIAHSNDFLYVVDFDWNDYSDHISKINLQTKEVNDITSIYEDYAMVYSVSVNPLNNDIYLTNQGDDVVIFDKEYNQKLELKTGIAITSTVVPVIK